MKNKKKVAIIGTFIAAMALTSFAGLSMASINETTVLNNAPALYNEVAKGYNGGENGPIQIVKGTLTKDSKSKEAYLVMLSGTELISGQATGIFTDLQVGFEADNEYTKSIVSAITEYVPENSNLIVSGHSLGGMVAQQISGNKTIKNNYNILNVVTFGSPLINPIGREGTIKRLGDKADLVPYMSASGVVLPFWQITGLNREDGKYSNPVKAHTDSYKRDDLWGAYDVLGFKNGNASFSFDPTTVQYFKAPSSIFPSDDYQK